MDDRTVNDALEASRRLGFAIGLKHKIVQLVVEVVNELSTQHVEIDIAGAQDGRCVAIVEERQKQMFKRSIFMASLVCVLKRAMQRVFKASGE
jgi:hypothetical protein